MGVKRLDSAETRRFREYQSTYFASYGLQVKAHRLRLPGIGTSVEVLEAGAGEPLVLLHGGGGFADDWAPLAARLHRSFRLLMLYLPGHGLSDAVDFRGVNVRAYASRFLAEVVSQLGISRCAIVGNSIGGYWSLAFALDYPDSVTKLVLAGAPGGLGLRVPLFFRLMAKPGIGWFLGQLSRLSTPGQVRQMFGRFAVAQIDKVPQTYSDLVWAGLRLPGAGSSYRAMLRTLHATMKDIRRELQNLRSPILFLWGDKDVFGSPVNAEKAATGLKQCRVAVLPDAGHLPWFDAPDEVAALIERFVADTDGCQA